MIRTLLRLALGVAAAGPLLADDSVVNSKHDLSTFGPGPVRALHEDQVCIFCHTPHNASPAAPLWNRYNPTTYYRIYRSPTMQARVDQPGPASKLCLSCHDGSIALGLTLDRPLTDPLPMTHLYIPTGPADLTNDLSDDHPIGFRYDRALSNRDPNLRPPQLVDSRLPLGPRGEFECTACHDPHNNELGNFLRVTEREGALCTSCHEFGGWDLSAHRRSVRSVPVTVTNGQQLRYETLADNACLACHKTHTAPQPEWLLYDTKSQLCLSCHDGLGARDMHPVVDQLSGHRVNPIRHYRSEPEDRLRTLKHVECTDCHNPHAAAETLIEGALSTTLRGPQLPPALRGVPGVSLSGLAVDEARWYYEVCFRCHSDRPVYIRDRVQRQIDDAGNIRRQFMPTAASAHPVTFPARGVDEVPSLLAQQRTRQFISCQDCHNNADATGVGGGQPNGPHTSRYEPLLVARYETRDFTVESPQSYALCYECHDRNSILGNESFEWHSTHVVRGQTPCSACHSAHGANGPATQHDHLINFDISIVGGQRFFVDTGRFSGSCTLTCHGVNHVNFTYGTP